MASRRYYHNSQNIYAPLEVSPLVRLWLLRILIPLGGHKLFVDERGFKHDFLAEVIGLEKMVDQIDDFNLKDVRITLQKLHKDLELKQHLVKAPACLSTNVLRLADLVGLTQTDCRIIEFAVLINSERILDDAADWLGELSSVKAFHALSILLGIPEKDIRQSLSAQSVLARSGLVTVDRRGSATLRRKLDLLSDNFADSICSSEADPLSLLRDTVTPSAQALLTLDHYEHVAPLLSILQPYLKKSIETKRKGVNIFLHGNPGTGKSQLAKVLANQLNCELFEVASEDADGDPVNGEKRLRAFRAAQSFLEQRQAIILFDEVEDVFNDGNNLFGRKSTAQIRKAWINRILEESAVPTLWLSNSIDGLDPAFLRRFDMIFELPVPPKKQRARILMDNCGDLLDAITISRIAEVEALAPAVVAKASSVINSIRDELGSKNVAEAFEQLINNTLEAQGHQSTKQSSSSGLPELYDPMFINADANLAEVAKGLINAKSGRLCLFGPPGTGKTAYGKWLADQLGISLIVKRTSDIMSKWVGENEKNIALAFKQAEREGALLLIDEVDSFLQDRRGAQRGWEVSMVNEMLTQMESFSGVFIASTNLMEGLDQAALRRFDLKVKFDFLNSNQAWALLSRYCAKLNFAEPEKDLRIRINRLQQLTPGDFAAVLRQHRFRPIENASSLVSVLEAECAVKEGGKARIGFL